VIQLDSCPDCGGPLINAGGGGTIIIGGNADIRCVNCGMGLEEIVDYLGDDVDFLIDEEIELTDEFVGEYGDILELGYDGGDGSGAEDDSGW